MTKMQGKKIVDIQKTDLTFPSSVKLAEQLIFASGFGEFEFVGGFAGDHRFNDRRVLSRRHFPLRHGLPQLDRLPILLCLRIIFSREQHHTGGTDHHFVSIHQQLP